MRRKLAASLGVAPARLDALLENEQDSDAAIMNDEIEVLEMARRAAASDIGQATLARLDAAVDDLASSYATTQPAELLDRTRQHLGSTGWLLPMRTVGGPAGWRLPASISRSR